MGRVYQWNTNSDCCNQRELELHFFIHDELHPIFIKTYVFYSALHKNIVVYQSLNNHDNVRAILVAWNEEAIFSLGEFIYDGFTVYPKKYAHGFVVLCFVVVM